LNIINKLIDRNNLIRFADTSAGAGIPSESTNLVTSQIMTRTIKCQAEYRALKSIMEKTKVRRTPDKPPEERPFLNPAYGTTYTRQLPSCRTSVA